MSIILSFNEYITYFDIFCLYFGFVRYCVQVIFLVEEKSQYIKKVVYLISSVVAVLDPGHGGFDSGAIGPNGTRESDIALAVAFQAERYLSSAVKVHLTRRDNKSLANDASIDLKERASIAQKARANCFVSIHCNKEKDNNNSGVVTYHNAGNEKGRYLAASIHNKLVPAVGLFSRGLREKDFDVLNYSSCPSALVELAYISNYQEEALLKTADFQDRAAWAIASGIASYLGVYLNQIPDFPETPFEKLAKRVSLDNKCSENDPVTWDEFAAVLKKLGLL